MFVNYEISKLIIPYPTLQNIALLCIILLFAALFGIRTLNTVFLSKEQTDQLKGIAILLVVSGHLWYHVSLIKAVPILGDYAVTLFLVLSGYGLSIAYSKKRFAVKDFLLKRILRVMVPYWFITLVILVLDAQLLSRTYPAGQVLRTFLGINIENTLSHLDYTRWYITLLLAYYGAFTIVYRYVNEKRAMGCLMGFGLILTLLHIVRVFPLGTIDQILAFPLGCLLARNYDFVNRIIVDRHKRIKLLVSVIVIAAATSLSFLFRETLFLERTALSFFHSVNGFMFCSLLILFVQSTADKGYMSNFFAIFGLLSYEIYLIHGPLLIKYNPIFRLLSASSIIVSFAVFLALTLLLSLVLKRTTTWISVWVSTLLHRVSLYRGRPNQE